MSKKSASQFVFLLFFLISCQSVVFIEVTPGPIDISVEGEGEFFDGVGEKGETNISQPVSTNLESNSQVQVVESIVEYTIGKSADGRSISVTQIGNGSKAVVLIGGMHAGFAPASVDVAERALDYFSSNYDEVPQNVSLFIITNANPDSSTGGTESESGRVNGNNVDVNRNFPCNWQEEAVWRDEPINAGSRAFSEPEAIALRDFFYDVDPEVVIFYEAKGSRIAPGICNGRSISERVAGVYGSAAGYVVGQITGYSVTGDVSDWLNSEGIPSFAVLLPDYTTMDWFDNLDGIKAILNYIS